MALFSAFAMFSAILLLSLSVCSSTICIFCLAILLMDRMMPNAEHDMRNALAPSLISGSVCPVIGIRSTFTAMCMNACPVIRKASPPTAILANPLPHSLAMIELRASRLTYSTRMSSPPRNPYSSTMKLYI